MKIAAVGTWRTAACLSVMIAACGSSGNSTASPTTSEATSSPVTTAPVQTIASSPESSSAATAAPTSVAPSTTALPAAVVGTVALTLTGDINAALVPDPSGPTCGQTGPQSVAIFGDFGGHRGSILLVSDGVGAVQLPSNHVASADLLPDGLGGAEFKASAITGAGSGSLTFNADGSGSVDLEIPYVGGASFAGTSVHVTGTWTC